MHAGFTSNTGLYEVCKYCELVYPTAVSSKHSQNFAKVKYTADYGAQVFCCLYITQKLG